MTVNHEHWRLAAGGDELAGSQVRRATERVSATRCLIRLCKRFQQTISQLSVKKRTQYHGVFSVMW